MSVLQRRPAADDGFPARDAERLDRIRAALLAAREGRPRPGRDDKVVAAWNGMAIGTLAEAGILFGRPDFVAAATAAAELLVNVHLAEGRGRVPGGGHSGGAGGATLVRTSRDGVAGTSAGQLEDYACVAAGLLVLVGVTGETRWASVARDLLETVLTEFPDGQGGFYDAPADGEKLIFRPADPLDGATPSGTFAAADALTSFAALTGSARHRDAAVAALRVLPAVAGRHPRACGMGLAVTEALLAGPVEVAVVGAPDDSRTRDLLRTAVHAARGGSVLAIGNGVDGEIPLLAGRGLVGGAPAAYVCRGFTCRLPVSNSDGLREQLSLRMNAQ
jgi:hypothetical protein